MTEDLTRKVIDIVSDRLGKDPSEIQAKTSFTDDLQADSLAVVELVMALEEEFGLEIPDDEAEKIRTVGDAVSYIETHR